MSSSSSVLATLLFLLFSLSRAACDRDDRLYLLEIRLPTLEHRQESSELYYIHKFLREKADDRDKHIFKVQGEPRVFAVILMNEECKWEGLSSTFVQMGEDFFVTALYDGRHFAEDVGIDRSMIPNIESSLENRNQYLIDVTFKTEGESFLYADTVKNMTGNFLSTWPHDSKMAFYKVLGQVPIRILIFANLTPSGVESLTYKFDCPAKSTIKVIPLMSLDDYSC